MKRLIVLTMLVVSAPVCVWGDSHEVVPDTMLVTADREDLAEVIAAVGRRMRAADLRAAPYSYTTETIRRDRFGAADTIGVTVVYRTVARMSRDRDGSVRKILLVSSTRRFEDGVLVWESRQDDPGSAQWREPARPLLESLPFAEGAADRYGYQVLARQLVGNTLLYNIAFEPRNPFDKLPSGQVWVDYAGWVMRRLTAHMDPGTTPTALLNSVPVYRVVQEQRGGLWLPVDIHLVMELKPSPLVTTPQVMDIQVKITDVEVHGDVDDRHRRLTADGRDPREFWLDPEAAADSLAVFWTRVDRPWVSSGSCLSGHPGRSVSSDSVRDWADVQLADLAAQGRHLRRGLVPLLPRFNRVQGLVPRVKLELKREGSGEASARAILGLGLATGRLDGRGMIVGGASEGGARWQLEAGSQTRSFGMVADPPLRDGAALITGHDPRSFYADRRAQAGLRWGRTRGVFVEGSVAAYRQRSLQVATRWNLVGAGLSPDDNLVADSVSGQRVGFDLGWRSRPWNFRGGLLKLTGLGRKGPLQMSLDARWQGMDSVGNAWMVQVHGRRWTRTAPLQDQVWLGDAGSLSGWSAGVLRGNVGVWGSVEVEGAWDPWRSLGIPVLARLGLQPVGLLEAGWTAEPGVWNVCATDVPPSGPLGSLGIGFQRYLGLPMLGDRQKLRLMASWPLGPGASDAGLRLVLGLAKGAGAP